MSDENTSQKPASVWTVIFQDVHFWVPLIVLLTGLALLHWIR